VFVQSLNRMAQGRCGLTPQTFCRPPKKLRSSASSVTARNADRTLSSSRTVYEWYSQALVDFTDYSGKEWFATLRWEGGKK
jgi:hypothetical protein